MIKKDLIIHAAGSFKKVNGTWIKLSRKEVRQVKENGSLKKKKKSGENSVWKKAVKRSENFIVERNASEMSRGETVIAEFLKNNQVRFKREHYKRGCLNENKSYVLFFDFFLPDYNMVIEFDGVQHFKGEGLKRIQANDKKKNAFCRKKGIKLLRIPYWNFNQIEDIICEFLDKHFK